MPQLTPPSIKPFDLSQSFVCFVNHILFWEMVIHIQKRSRIGRFRPHPLRQLRPSPAAGGRGGATNATTSSTGRSPSHAAQGPESTAEDGERSRALVVSVWEGNPGKEKTNNP